MNRKRTTVLAILAVIILGISTVMLVNWNTISEWIWIEHPILIAQAEVVVFPDRQPPDMDWQPINANEITGYFITTKGGGTYITSQNRQIVLTIDGRIWDVKNHVCSVFLYNTDAPMYSQSVSQHECQMNSSS